MNQLNDGSDQLLDASKEVQNGSKHLADGIYQANEGIQEMGGKVPQLVSGTNQVQDGLKEFQDELPKQMATTIGDQIENSVGTMNKGLDELQSGIKHGLTKELAPGLTDGLASGLANELVNQQEEQGEILANVLLQNGLDEQTVGNIVKQLGNNSPSEKTIREGMHKQLKPQIEGAIKQSTSGIDGGFAEYKTAVNGKLTNSTGGLEKQIKKAIDPSLNQLRGGLNDINEGQTALIGGVNQLADGTNQLKDGSDQLASGQSVYVDNMQTFNQKLSEATDGSSALVSGTNQLFSGMNELADGSEKLSDGSEKLSTGSSELADGTGKLTDGTEELRDKMKDAAKESDIETNIDTYNMMANPIEVNSDKINEVPNYGTGFAPYFLSLGLFVGALLLSIVYPLREPASKPTSGFNWFLSKFVVLFVIGVFQALIASGILLIGLGLEVQSVPLFILYAIVTSLVFITLIQFFVTCFDDPGRFIAIILLIMQLTTSAGTFPLELIPKALQPFNALLPMTYTVQGFKAVISSGDYAVMWQNVGILMGFTVVFMLGTLTYFMLKFKRKYGVFANDEEVVT